MVLFWTVVAFLLPDRTSQQSRSLEDQGDKDLEPQLQQLQKQIDYAEFQLQQLQQQVRYAHGDFADYGIESYDNDLLF